MCSERLTSLSLEGRTSFSESTRQRITRQPGSKNWLAQASWVVASSKQMAPQRIKKQTSTLVQVYPSSSSMQLLTVRWRE